MRFSVPFLLVLALVLWGGPAQAAPYYRHHDFMTGVIHHHFATPKPYARVAVKAKPVKKHRRVRRRRRR